MEIRVFLLLPKVGENIEIVGNKTYIGRRLDIQNIINKALGLLVLNFRLTVLLIGQ